MISLFSSNLNASYEKLAFDFSFKDLDGSEMKLADFKDKVMVVTNVVVLPLNMKIFKKFGKSIKIKD